MRIFSPACKLKALNFSHYKAIEKQKKDQNYKVMYDKREKEGRE